MLMWFENKLGWTMTVFSILFMAVLSGCADNVQFTSQSSTQFFTQDFIPEFVDIMWVINDRSPMVDVRTELTQEATRFFQRLDAVAHQYQMGFVTADMLIKKGRLVPLSAPAVLTKEFGTIEQRTTIFTNNILNILPINLSTSGTDKGFEATLIGLTENTPAFVLRENVPLVLVFISDADDHSLVPGGGDAIDYYAGELLALKGNDPDLIRAYSINYVQGGDLCTGSKAISADILKPSFEDRYFKLAERLGGETADICGSWAESINLDGLRLEQLKTRFALEVVPNPDTIQVSVLMNGVNVPNPPPFQYVAATNEIVFEVPPPEGTTIAVTYLPASTRE